MIKTCVINFFLQARHQTAVSIELSRVLASLYVDIKRIRDIPRKRHVLLCDDHKHDAENVNLFEKYKKENILCLKSQQEYFLSL